MTGERRGVSPTCQESVLNQDAAHRLGSGREEVTAGGKLLVAHQPQVSLMNQGRRVKRLPRLLAGQLHRGEATELIRHQRQQLPGGLGVALCQVGQDVGDLVHERAQGSSDPTNRGKWRLKTCGDAHTAYYSLRRCCVRMTQAVWTLDTGADRQPLAALRLGRLQLTFSSALRSIAPLAG